MKSGGMFNSLKPANSVVFCRVYGKTCCNYSFFKSFNPIAYGQKRGSA